MDGCIEMVFLYVYNAVHFYVCYYEYIYKQINTYTKKIVHY